MLTLSNARKIVDHVLERAKELNVSVSVAVCDQGGRFIALNQMDGSVGWEADRCSIGKSDRRGHHRTSQCSTFRGIQQRRRAIAYIQLVPPLGQSGGLPIVEADVVQGGCGGSGAATPEQDEECASAGIAAFACTGTECPPTLTAVPVPSPW